MQRCRMEQGVRRTFSIHDISQHRICLDGGLSSGKPPDSTISQESTVAWIKSDRRSWIMAGERGYDKPYHSDGAKNADHGTTASELDAELGSGSVHPHRARGCAEHFAEHPVVVFVIDLADDLFKNVLHRDDTQQRPLGIDDRHMHPPFLQQP